MYKEKNQFWWKLSIMLNVELKGNKMASKFYRSFRVQGQKEALHSQNVSQSIKFIVNSAWGPHADFWCKF